jgi:hypothetical protein
MSLLPDSASFAERVQDVFVAFRGRGVSLSPKDAELVEAWEGTGVPVEVITRGIKKAAEAKLFDAREGEGLRTLAACRRQVEAEIKKYLKLSAGKTESAAPGDEPFHLTAHKKLVAQVKRLAPENAAWLARISPPTDFLAGERTALLISMRLLRSLDWAKRQALLREARLLVQKTHTTSPGARRESLRFHRAALLRHHLGLKSLW